MNRKKYRKEYYLKNKSKELLSKREWRLRNQPESSLRLVWGNMMSRCYNEHFPKYPRYGKRGIKVFESWHDFNRFKDWALTNGYQIGLTVDRVDNNGNYEPDNCQFLTKGENSRKQFSDRKRQSESPNTFSKEPCSG